MRLGRQVHASSKALQKLRIDKRQDSSSPDANGDASSSARNAT